MKILIVNKFLHTVGGSETYCFALENVLKQHGHDVIWFSMKDKLNKECKNSNLFVNNINYNTKNPFKKFYFACKYLYSFEAKRKIAKLLDDEKPDVVHFNLVHHQITLSIVSEIVKRNIPIVWTLHDLVGICPNYLMLNKGAICEKCLKGKFNNCFKAGCVKDSKLKSALATIEAQNYYRSGVYNKIDCFITPSLFYKEKYIQGGFNSSKIVYIPNLMEPSVTFEPCKKRGDYILYFGRISKEKGIKTLIEAMKNVNHKLLIVGKGALQNELADYVLRNGLHDKIMFLGFKSGLELKKIISKAKCVVLPSEWYENGPYSIMEAMSIGTPIIASNIGGLPEIVKDNITGYLFRMGDKCELQKAIEKIYSLTMEEYFLMCEKASLFAKEKFEAEKYYSQLINIYKESLNRHYEHTENVNL